MASRRILMEWKELQNNPNPSFSVGRVGEDLYPCQATITGPPDSPYAGGVFLVTIDFPRDYPFKEPKITFNTKVFHPSINYNGYMWLDFMDEGWNPSMRILEVLLSICSCLTDPKPKNVLEPEIAKMYLSNRAKYENTARIWTQKYAMG